MISNRINLFLVSLTFFANALVVLAISSGQAQESPQYLYFDGIDDYVSTSHMPFNGPFTIEVWHMNWSHYLCSQGATGDPENSVWLSTSAGIFDGCGWENNEKEYDVNYAQNVGQSEPGKWVHMAMVYDGGTQMIFVDGKIIGKKECPGPGELKRNREFIIGAEPSRDDNQSWNYGSGFLKSFRVSKCARYTSDFVPPPTFDADDNTILLLTHEAVNGNMLLDQSKENNNAMLHGARLVSPDRVNTCLFQGKIINPDGNPAADIYVLLRKDNVLRLATITDNQGHFNLTINNPKGEYDIEAGDWHRIAPGRWASTMETEVKGIILSHDDQTLDDIKLTSVPQNPLNELAFLVGEWENINPNGDREKANFEWINNSSFIMLTVGNTTEIIGLDLETKQLASWDFGGGGGYGRMQWTKLDDGWRVEAKPHWWFGDGQTGKMWWVIKVISKDEVHLEGGMAVGGGKESHWTVVSKRIQEDK